jgi:endonuclease YncB( thermonuclease family)
MKLKIIGLLSLLMIFFLIDASPAMAHRDGCHGNHSCPSDTGSYVCGDTGNSSQCPTAGSTTVKQAVSQPTSFPTRVSTVKPTKSQVHAIKSYSETAMDKQKMFKVISVTDGDTIKVNVRGKIESVRLLGIDTPETVDPRIPVQCFGKEASNKMKSLVSGQFVKLLDDRTQGNRDKYNRLLRYVYLPNGTFVNEEMVKLGFATSYKQYPTKYLNRFNTLEKNAREQAIGLWAACSGTSPTSKILPIKSAVKAVITKAPTPKTLPTSSSVSTSGGDKDCPDFPNHDAAQAYFIAKGGSPTNNVDRLDNDHDGLACEALP